MMLALLAVPFALQAQTKFHDVELNEATGPVKSITQAGMMGRGEQVVKFSQDGKMEAEGMSGLVYDDNGYLQKAERSVETPQGNMKIVTTYKWENGKVKSQSMDFGQGAMTQVYEGCSRIYDNGYDGTGDGNSLHRLQVRRSWQLDQSQDFHDGSGHGAVS